VRSIRRGDTGPAVEEIQSILVSLELLPAVAETFDETTENAVRAFQQSRGIGVDGLVGDETWGALDAARWRLGARTLYHSVTNPLVGEDVRALQERLLEMGYDTGRADSIYGLRTARAVAQFQREVGLTPDGSCGPNTMKALRRLGRKVVGGRPQWLREAEAFRQAGTNLMGKTIVIESADGRDVLTGIEHLKFTDGTIDVKDKNPLVNDLFYYANNKDVWDSGVDADVHYATFGFREGRDPNAEFSTNGYLSANPDVRAAGVNPLEHFATFGFKEGRDPSPNFDIEQYLAANPDVAISGSDPLTHYETFGRDEGRATFAAVGNPSHNGFDAEFYLLANPDVGFAGVDPLRHYQTFGHNEGRAPNAFFDVQGYLAAYSDVAAAGVDPLRHYLEYGAKEGRDLSGAFDTAAYLAANPDVAAAGVNPLLHFLEFGVHEGRSPHGGGLFA